MCCVSFTRQQFLCPLAFQRMYIYYVSVPLRLYYAFLNAIMKVWAEIVQPPQKLCSLDVFATMLGGCYALRGIHVRKRQQPKRHILYMKT